MFSQRSFIQYYCAITPLADSYALAAIEKHRHHIVFHGFHLNSLPSLAKQFKKYGLALAIADQHLEIHTHFCHPADSDAAVYQRIVQHVLPKCRTAWFDFERIEQTEETSKQDLVISYHLLEDAWLKPYRELGFHFTALEPFSVLEKRSVTKDWQIQTLKNQQTDIAFSELDARTLNLKLLDRENFYESFEPEFISLAYTQGQ